MNEKIENKISKLNWKINKQQKQIEELQEIIMKYLQPLLKDVAVGLEDKITIPVYKNGKKIIC
jgi:hypothetical protein